MDKKTIAVGMFIAGVLFMLVHTSIAALWTALGLPGNTPLSSDSGVLYYMQGFTPIIGVFLLWAAGLVYGDSREG